VLYFNFRFLTLLSLLLSFDAYAQRFRNGVTEFGLFLGASNYTGDIAPEIVWSESHPAIGLMYKYHHSKYFSSRYQFTYASISGSDQNFSANTYRNISFESDIYELGYNVEFNFKPLASTPTSTKKIRLLLCLPVLICLCLIQFTVCPVETNWN